MDEILRAWRERLIGQVEATQTLIVDIEARLPAEGAAAAAAREAWRDLKARLAAAAGKDPLAGPLASLLAEEEPRDLGTAVRLKQQAADAYRRRGDLQDALRQLDAAIQDARDVPAAPAPRPAVARARGEPVEPRLDLPTHRAAS